MTEPDAPRLIQRLDRRGQPVRHSPTMRQQPQRGARQRRRRQHQDRLRHYRGCSNLLIGSQGALQYQLMQLSAPPAELLAGLGSLVLEVAEAEIPTAL
jgi:hypothetical protein